MYMEYKNNVNRALNRLSALYQNGVEYFEEPCDLETNGELENHNQAESFRTKTRKDKAKKKAISTAIQVEGAVISNKVERQKQVNTQVRTKTFSTPTISNDWFVGVLQHDTKHWRKRLEWTTQIGEEKEDILDGTPFFAPINNVSFIRE